VERRVVLKSRYVWRRIVEETLAHAILVRAIIVLQAAPEDLVDEFLVLGNLVLVGLAELFHGRRQPRSGSAFVAQPGNPGTTVLGYLLVGFAIVADDRRRAVEWIRAVVEPLFGEKKVAEIGRGLSFRFDRVITDRLLRVIVVGDRQPRATPRLTAQRITLPT